MQYFGLLVICLFLQEGNLIYKYIRFNNFKKILTIEVFMKKRLLQMDENNCKLSCNRF